MATPVRDGTVGRLLSLNVGGPRDVEWEGKTVRTAIWKEPVSGSRMVRRINIDGDDQADRAAHGGEHRAVYVYQIGSYRYWERELGRQDFSYGQFGENFTVEGLSDDEVCIGDRYRIGAALFEVTQPRVTCFRLGIRMAEARMPSLRPECRAASRARWRREDPITFASPRSTHCSTSPIGHAARSRVSCASPPSARGGRARSASSSSAGRTPSPRRRRPPGRGFGRSPSPL
jgi:MOSC domain-containing protein YiiM